MFPIGMYSAATGAVSRSVSLPALQTVSLVVSWVGLAAWIMVAAGAIQRALLRLGPADAARGATEAGDES